MKIAVVGASGFVGGHILRVLRAAGEDVRAVVRNRHALSEDPDRRVADAQDVYAMRDALAGCRYLVHAVVGTPEMILATLAPVYAAAEAVGVSRFVYISTGVVHGQAPAPGTTESSPLTVRQPFPYNAAKVRAERKLLQLRSRGTVEIVLLRPTIVFGPGSRWVNDFAQALRGSTACLVDGGRGICNSIYVDNLAHAVRRALIASGADREAFLVGDRERVSWADLYRAIAEGLGYDFDRIASVSPPPFQLGFRRAYLEPVRTSEIGQLLITRVPASLKTAIKRAYRIPRRSRQVLTRAAVPVSGQPLTVSEEVALLQRCRWRLPSDKAGRLLGYSPPVSFAEGCERSLAWLRSSTP